jgi:hypothetical protein
MVGMCTPVRALDLPRPALAGALLSASFIQLVIHGRVAQLSGDADRSAYAVSGFTPESSSGSAAIIILKLHNMFPFRLSQTQSPFLKIDRLTGLVAIRPDRVR